jgi:drug/metabolite transporter (DMT)-like permease
MVGIGMVNLATISWALNIVLGRWLRSYIGPLSLAAARFLVASLCFAIILGRLKPEERRLGSDRWLLLGMALSGVVAFSPVLYLGLRYTTAVNTTLIMGLGPLITGLLAGLLIHEPMSGQQIIGAIISFTGVAILLFEGSFAFWRQLRGNIGDVIVLGAATLFGLYSVLGRQVMRNRSPISTTAFSAFLGLPFLLLAATWEAQKIPIYLHFEVILALLFIGIGATFIGFLSWNAGVRRLGASGAMAFYNTLPLYGVFMGYLFLHESILLTHLIGGGLIICGGLLASQVRS